MWHEIILQVDVLTPRNNYSIITSLPSRWVLPYRGYWQWRNISSYSKDARTQYNSDDWYNIAWTPWSSWPHLDTRRCEWCLSHPWPIRTNCQPWPPEWSHCRHHRTHARLMHSHGSSFHHCTILCQNQ